MSDIPQLPIDQPEVVPNDFKAEFPCPEPGCDKVYPSRLGLQGHQISHKPPVNCPECGKEYKSPGALGNHRKNQHGVPAMYPAVAPKKAKVPINPSWHYDDVFESVVASLWPSGLVPVRCVLPLVEWREATREFLEKVQSE
jgi:hypothetical protein